MKSILPNLGKGLLSLFRKEESKTIGSNGSKNGTRPFLKNINKILMPLLFAVLGNLASAQTSTRFNDGYLTVFKVTSGATLGNTGTAIVTEEYLPVGASQSAPNYSVALASTGTIKVVVSGSATSAGAMTRSENGRYLAIPGFNALIGDANSTFTTNGTVRTLDAAGVLGAGVVGTLFATANDLRGAASDDGTNFWVSGGSIGIRHTNNGTTVTTVSTTSTNTRVVNIFNGQLYYATGSGTNGIYKVGTGKPTTTGQTSVLQAAATAPYSFSVSPDGLTIYAFSSANQIARFTYNGSAWSAASTGFTLSAATGVAVDWNGYSFSTGANGARIYACNPLTLVAGNDNGTGAISTTTLRTLTGNNGFRGLAFSPVKETVSLGAASPSTGNISQGSINAVLFQFKITADEGNSTLRKLMVNQGGTASIGTSNSLDNFRLIYDANGDGIASAGEISALLATGTVSGSDITFSGISQTYIAQGSSNNYLVIANVAGGGTGTFIPNIVSNKTINSVNYTTNLLNAGGSPINIGTTAPTGNTLTITAATSPTIASSGVLSAVNTVYGTASATPATFTASGSNLTSDIVVTAPSGFEISKTVGGASGYATAQTLTQTAGTVASTTIYVRLAATTVFGTYSGNITLVSSPATTINVATVSSTVSKKGLTVSGAAAVSKIYNRTTAATISGATAVGTVNGDAITISGGGTFATAYAGISVAVTPAMTFSGTNATSYTLTQPSGLSANIVAKDITITAAFANNKQYDGNTAAVLSGTLAGVISPDDVSLTLIGDFDSPFADVNINVTSSSFISGVDIANYNLSQPVITANITPKALTIASAVALNKVYDGNTNAVITGTLAGVISPDDVTLIVSGTFATSAIGLNIAVTSNSSIVGDISNYTLTQPAGLTANISAAALTDQTITFDALSDVVYGDANFNLTATASSGLTVSYISSDSAIATISGNTVTIVGVGTATITAIQSGDLTYDSAAVVDQILNVNVKELTIAAATAGNKVYDGNNAATISGTLSGIVGTDVVTLNGTGLFAAVSAGNAISVTAASTLGGANASNYSLAQPTGLTADITPKALTVDAAIAANKVYNGITLATITGASLSGVVGTDSVTVSGGGVFASANVANGIAVSAALVLGGSDASSYSITQPTGLSANITPLALTISGLTGVNKVYDRTTAATLSGTAVLNGVIGSDFVTVSGIPAAVFANKTVGTAKAITVTAYTLGGAQAADYTVSQPAGITANITVASLTISSAVAQNKPFDGTAAATITGTLAGVIAADVVTLVGTGTFASSPIGTAIAVTSTSTLAGADAVNYVINPQPSGLTANIVTGPTVFAVGDLSIIGFNVNAPDNFAFVTWVDILNGTIIKFTDNGFLAATSANATGNARGGENFVIWKNNGATIPAGTVITIQDDTTASTNVGSIVSGVLNGLSASGDNIFAYQGAATSGTFPDFTANGNPTTFNGTVLFGLYAQGTSAITSWITTGTASSNSSYLPTQLNVVNGNIAIGSLSTKGQYTGSRANQITMAGYKSMVTNVSNWTAAAGAGIITLNTTNFTLLTGPTASVLSGSTTICEAASTNLHVAITGGTAPFTVVYNNGTADVTVNGYASGANISVAPSATTTYTLVSVTDANTLAGTGNSGSAVITVNPIVIYYADADGDGFGNIAASQTSCMGTPANYVANSTDCKDTDATRHATYSFYVDADGDGYGVSDSGLLAVCAVNGITTAGYSTNAADCDDTKSTVHPFGTEIGYDLIDNDCDGLTDEGFPPKVTVIAGNQCNTVLTQIDSYVYANLVAGAQGYSWRVTTMSGPAAGQVQFANSYLRNLRITQLGTYAFNTTYKIEVAVLYNGFLQPYTTSSCTVSTPETTTNLTNCGGSITAMTDVIYANIVPFATGYKFRVTNVLNPLDTQTVARSLREFRMSLLSNIQYNATYTVEVAVRNIDGTYLAYGPVCTVNTALFPTTSVQESQCELAVVPSMSTIIYADAFSGAEAYRFQLSNASPLYSQEVDRVLRTFSLSNFTGLIAGQTYAVKVSLKLNGIWGPYGKTCSVTVPGAARMIEPAAPVVLDVFKAAAYPNPFASSFRLDVNSSSEERVEVKVYDMIGRLVEVRQVSVSDFGTQEVGERCPTGVYNIVVSQGKDLKTLKVIKR